MGFALLAGVPAVYGLYASIFPGWVYYLFGTSRHLSVGTMALTALMVGAVVARSVPGICSYIFDGCISSSSFFVFSTFVFHKTYTYSLREVKDIHD